MSAMVKRAAMLQWTELESEVRSPQGHLIDVGWITESTSTECSRWPGITLVSVGCPTLLLSKRYGDRRTCRNQLRRVDVLKGLSLLIHIIFNNLNNSG